MAEGRQKAKGGRMVTSEWIRAKQLRLLTDKRSWLDCKALSPARMRSSSNCPASKKVIDPDRYRGPLASLATHNFTFVLSFPLKNAQRKGDGSDEIG